MKVLKFGGTSVGTVEGIRNIKTIVEAEPTPVIVVVSALKTVTNNLVKVTQLAVKGDAGYTELLRDIIDFHNSYIDTIIDDGVACTALKQQVGSLLDELSSILRGVYLIKDVTPKTEDAISATANAAVH